MDGKVTGSAAGGAAPAAGGAARPAASRRVPVGDAEGCRCPCGGAILDAGGELVCGSCGRVAGYGVEMPRDALPAGRMADFGPATTVGRPGAGYAGGRVPAAGAAARLRRRDRRARTRNRYLAAALAQVSGMGGPLGMTEACTEYAAYVLRKAASSGFLAGRAVRCCAAAAVLLACRKHGLNRTIQDVMKATGLGRRAIYRTYSLLCRRFGPGVPVPDPALHVSRIAGAVGISEAARRDAVAILSSAGRTEIAGKNPVGLAAGALCLSCDRRGEAVRRRDLAKAAGISETTLYSRYRSLGLSGAA